MNQMVYTKLNYGQHKVVESPESSDSVENIINESEGEFSLPSIDEWNKF